MTKLSSAAAAAPRRPGRGALFSLPPSVILLAAAAIALPRASAHSHGASHIEEGHAVSDAPIDTTLWVHIVIQTVAWGLVFPLGMVLGIAKSRWHVPVQTLGVALSIVAYALGHMHGGREFRHGNAHSKFATPISACLFLQVLMGIYLKLHLERGINGRIRRYVRAAHGLLGKAMPLLSWAQMLFGGITALGFCQGDYLDQCVAHFIMGSSFVAYAVLLTVALVAGQLWIRRSGRSQEFYDSVVIAAWGCVSAVTRHRWSTEHVTNDWEQSSMGLVWWCAGLAGIWLSRDRDGRPQRNVVPGFVIAVTGWAMVSYTHDDGPETAQSYSLFGYALVAAGISRIVEVSFLLRDAVGFAEDGRQVHSFQYVPIFLLYVAGFLFLGSSEEQMKLVASTGADATAYLLMLVALSFLVFIFVNLLVSVVDRPGGADGSKLGGTSGQEAVQRQGVDGQLTPQEFELEGLMSGDEDDEDEDDGSSRRRRRSSSSSSAEPKPKPVAPGRR